MANNTKLELNPELLDEEYSMLLNELDSLTDLYDDAKKRLDMVAKTPTRSSPTFITNQTANLISIKEKRLNIIKELSNIKKSKMDIELKNFNANNKLDDVQSGVSREILDIYRLLNKNDKSVLLEETINDTPVVEEPSDEEINKIFEARLELDVSNKKEKKKKEQTLPSEYSIVCTKDKTLYIIDSDYNIIEDLDFDTSVIDIVRFDSFDGEEYAYDKDNNRYEVVEI